MENSIDFDQVFSRDSRIPVGPSGRVAARHTTAAVAPVKNDITVASDAPAPLDPQAAANPFGTTINLGSLGALGIKITGASGAASGLGVSAVGDFNHDGIADFIIGGGGAHATTGGQSLGEEYVIFGKVGLASFTLSPGIAATAGFRIGGEDYPENAGTTFSFAGIGDINNDGFQDVMFGATAYNTDGLGNNNVGAAYVVFGKSTGIGAVQLGSNMGATGFKITGAEAQGQIGVVSAAGDFNHDGIADFAVGGRFVDGNGADSGAVQIFFGKASGWGDLTFGGTTTPSLKLVGATGDFLGGKISSAGDVNGDGFDDLIVSATHGSTNPAYNTTAGFAYVVYGSASPTGTLNVSTMPTTAGFKITGDATHPVLGIDVAGIGDFNGDGFDDVAVSSGEYYGSQGRTYIVFGHATGAAVTVSDAMASTVGFEIIGTGVEDAGYSISRAGDVNGDGLADIIIGAPGRSSTSSAAYVIFGKTSGFGTINLNSLAAGDGFKIVGTSGSQTGISVAGVGDVNGDHVDDLLVSAPGEGASYVIFGISTAPVNVAPVIDLNGAVAGTGATLAYTENAGATALAPTATVTDTDSANFDTGKLTVSFTANGSVDDRLSIISTGNGAGQIGVAGNAVSYGGTQIGTFTGGTNGSTPLVVTLDSDATPAAVQALARAIAYANVSDDPSIAARTVQFVVTDGDGGTSAAAAATVNVTAVNDVPTLASGGNTIGYTENATGTVINPGLVVNDVDNANLTGATVTINGRVTGDMLNFVNQNGITGNFNGATGVLTLSGSSSVANYQAALRSVTFSSTSDDPTAHGASASRTINVVVDDGQAANHASGPASTTINVTSVNDAPSGADATIGARHGVIHTLTLADFGYSDLDGNAFASVTFDSVPSVGRLLLANGSGVRVAVTPGQTVSAADIAAGKLVYKPLPGVNDAPTGSLTFRVQDDGGVLNGGHDTDPIANTLTFTVPPNNAPSGTDATIGVQHGVLHVVTAADFGFSDVDGDAFLSVTITSAVTAGRLLLATGSGTRTDVTAGQTISAADIAAGKLVYKPTPGQNDTPVGAFSFQVHDNGGTSNGGVDTDPTPNTVTYDAGAGAGAGTANATLAFDGSSHLHIDDATLRLPGDALGHGFAAAIDSIVANGAWSFGHEPALMLDDGMPGGHHGIPHHWDSIGPY